jgi:hypothetical protein
MTRPFRLAALAVASALVLAACGSSGSSGTSSSTTTTAATGSARPASVVATKTSSLGTTKRADGSREVTSAGHPLYYYAGDTTPGQTTGQGSDGFGSPWWVVSPAGQAIQSQ